MEIRENLMQHEISNKIVFHPIPPGLISVSEIIWLSRCHTNTVQQNGKFKRYLQEPRHTVVVNIGSPTTISSPRSYFP